MATLETLKAARKLIEKPEQWAQGTCARGKSGRVVDVMGRKAVKFCPFGAIWRITDGDFREADRVLSSFMNKSIPDFNDTHTHAEVLAAFDKAIAQLEATHA